MSPLICVLIELYVIAFNSRDRCEHVVGDGSQINSCSWCSLE